MVVTNATDDGTSSPILAGGGVVWRFDPAPVVAIVHRPQYDDWVLPKGKLLLNEAALTGAIREVEEETGHRVAVREFLGSIAYAVNERSKVVLFWQMEAIGETGRALESDVDQVEWLPPELAANKLTHPLEQHFLRSATRIDAPATGVRRRPKLFERLFDTSAARLRQVIASYEIELNRTIAKSPSDKTWAPLALSLLARARRAAEAGNPEIGWQCFKAATRMELYGLPNEELHQRAIRLNAEIREKLRPWRSEAVKGILLQNGALKAKLNASDVAAAAQLLHEHEDNSYRLLRMRWRHFAILGICLVVSLCLVFLSVQTSEAPKLLHPWSLFHVSMLGVLGASISGILRVGGSTGSRRIPDELSGFGALIARLAVGAGAAVLLVALWHAGFMKLVNIANSPELTTALAIAAGFSERLAQNAIERLTGTAGQNQSSSGPRTSPQQRNPD